MKRVGGEIATDLAKSVDPRGWMQAAPWTTLAAAALVGFAGTALVVPSKEEQALRRLRKLEKELRAQERERYADANGNGHGRYDGDREKDKGHSSFLGSLAGHAFQMLKPLVTSALSAALTAHTVQPEQPGVAPAAGDGSAADPAS